MKKFRLLFFAVCGALVCAAAFYFLYYQNTPSNSLALAYQAARRHDLAAFEERVDLDSVLGYAYDDTVNEAGSFFAAEEQRLAGSFLSVFKKVFVLGMKELVRGELRQKEPQSGGKAFKLPELPFAARDFFKQMRPEQVDYRGTGRSDTNGDSAAVEILLFDRELNKEIVLTAGLEKHNGIWRLTRIEHAGVYLMQLRAARQAARKETKTN